ncbi:ACR2.1 [Symbiodinium sp. CCMP2592]|nr:ACR2.1 [Symbiodinium sp. CCMP2592]
MEHMQVPVVQTTTKTVVSAPRSFVPGPPAQARAHTAVVQTATKTIVSAPRPAPTGLVGPNFEVPLQKGVEKLSPGEVCELLQKGQCCLIDVRGDDRASGYIEGAVHEPTSFQAPLLNRVPELVKKFGNEKLVIFHCQYSLHRGPQSANWYRQQAPPTQRVAVLEGGFRGWEGQRLPVVREKLMDAHGQAKADVYALSMGRRVAGAGA